MPVLTGFHCPGMHAIDASRTARPREEFGQYCYLFQALAEQEARSVPQGCQNGKEYLERLDTLRNTMETLGSNRSDGPSNIPAAYTYFGQFLNHDMSAPVNTPAAGSGQPGIINSNPDLIALMKPDRTGDPAALLDRMRNEHPIPMILDSLYGGGPQSEISTSHYVPGTAMFVLAETYDDPDPEMVIKKEMINFNGKSRADLPRNGKAALIADRRNDENLVLSQLHLAFMLFHNQVVVHLHGKDPALGSGELFVKARKLVTRHYQWCILHDYLDRGELPARRVFKGIAPGSIASFKGLIKEKYRIPLEFTTAAYRFGHAMVSATYDYNEAFSGGPERPPADLTQLFSFTSQNGMNGQVRPGGATPQVPTHWIIDWNKFVSDPPKGTAAEQINPLITAGMFILMREILDVKLAEDLNSICKLNLLRGYHRFIPSGQALAKELNLVPMTPDEIRSCFPDVKTIPTGTMETFQKLLTDDKFGGEMPAWAYFLCEARFYKGGNALGPVAGTIVGETIIGLLKQNPDSVLNTAWKPDDPDAIRTANGKPVDSLRRILEFAGAVACEENA